MKRSPLWRLAMRPPPISVRWRRPNGFAWTWMKSAGQPRQMAPPVTTAATAAAISRTAKKSLHATAASRRDRQFQQQV